MTAFSFGELERAISPARAGRYLRSAIDSSTGEANPDLAVALYEFNSRLSAAAWSAVADIEVVLRNALAEAIATQHATIRQGPSNRWYDGPSWFPTGQWFTDNTLKAIKAAMSRADDPGPGAGSRPGVGRVIAEFNLGFWRYLLIARYEHSLWNPAMRAQFPALSHLSGSDSRKAVHARVERLNYLRNRIAHHEPVYEPFTVPGHAALLDPRTVLHEAIELVRWNNVAAAAWIDARSTFEAVAALIAAWKSVIVDPAREDVEVVAPYLLVPVVLYAAVHRRERRYARSARRCYSALQTHSVVQSSLVGSAAVQEDDPMNEARSGTEQTLGDLDRLAAQVRRHQHYRSIPLLAAGAIVGAGALVAGAGTAPRIGYWVVATLTLAFGLAAAFRYREQRTGAGSAATKFAWIGVGAAIVFMFGPGVALVILGAPSATIAVALVAFGAWQRSRLVAIAGGALGVFAVLAAFDVPANLIGDVAQLNGPGARAAALVCAGAVLAGAGGAALIGERRG